MKRIVLFFLCLPLVFLGCSIQRSKPSTSLATKPGVPTLAPTNSDLAFALMGAASAPRAEIGRAVADFHKSHPDIQAHLVSLPGNGQKEPPDLAVISAGDLQKMAAAGGVEPMGARLKPAWLKQFSPKAVERCMIATRIFAMPWLVGNQGKDDWVLISFALSLHKPQAVELMKFLATDPATLKEMSKVTGLRAARQGF